jgi:hypothetical protein
MISIEDFKVASFEKKCDLITRDTDFIISRSMDDVKVYLYHTGAFFIEVYYSVRFKKVLRIQAFNEVDYLEPYTVEISLDELMV